MSTDHNPNLTRVRSPTLRRARGARMPALLSIVAVVAALVVIAPLLALCGLALSESSLQSGALHHLLSTVLPGSVATDFMGTASPSDTDWKLLPDDVAQAIEDLLRHPLRSLPGHVELRPTHPPRKK